MPINLRTLFLFVIISGLFIPVYAQKNPDILPPPNIRTIVLSPNKANAYTPIIQLGESFSLSFDDLNADQKYYSYKIEHYDYNWQKSNLRSTEYINGYSTDRIRNFENSFNTLKFYTHYAIQIPNNNMRIKITGNYVLSVIDDDNNEVVFTRRFIVYQSRVDVLVSVHRSRNIEFIDQKHDVEFVIQHPNLNLRDPRNDVKVAIYQNFDWNTVKKDIPPKYITNGKLLYNYVSDISFWAGNEFLYFETKDIRNASNNVAKTRLDDIFNTYLYIDEARYNRAYSFYPDINGNFVLRTINGGTAALEGDYSMVHFKLDSKQDIGDRNIYIYGAYNDWKISEDNKMTYNSKSGLYEHAMLFKQGFYNYTYVTATSQDDINNHKIEGSYYQTEDEYTVIVYFKQFGDRYTQVVGVGKANSRILEN